MAAKKPNFKGPKSRQSSPKKTVKTVTVPRSIKTAGKSGCKCGGHG